MPLVGNVNKINWGATAAPLETQAPIGPAAGPTGPTGPTKPEPDRQGNQKATRTKETTWDL